MSLRYSLILAFSVCSLALPAQEPDVNAIMSRLGTNQDRAEQARAKYTYTQKVRIRALRSNGKLSREESITYNVLPTQKESKKDVVKFSGRYEHKGQIFEYQKPGEEIPGKAIDIDAGLLPELRDDLVNDSKSKDGLAKGLFPLTTDEQQKYRFELEGEKDYRGQQVYQIKFFPAPKRQGFDDDQTIWAGEALIEESDCEPISIVTHMAKGLPFLVKTLLGTNLHQLGFSVSYKKFDDGIYFPVTYGGEFQVRGLFLYKRTFAVSLENSDFKKGEAQSTISYGTAQ